MWQLVPQGNSVCLGAFGKMSGSHCRRFRPSPHPLPLLLILPLFRSFPPVRERLEKERKRLLRRLAAYRLTINYTFMYNSLFQPFNNAWLCYGLNLLPVQIFLKWFIFFKLVHIFLTSLYFSNKFTFIKLVHIFQTGLKFLNQFNFQFWAECERASLG